ncbi:MAG TPA: subclass B3 metallo-beta-lactamase [Vicinamibacteria bacterium]|nr:subclass B3 metallo-beta-lactamase [Vicinamibacteria bacterium]
MKRALLPALILLAAKSPAAADERADRVREWSKPMPAFRVLDNLYYVGTAELASFLLATRHGLVLVDSGIEESGAEIAASIRALGFEPADIELIVNSQAHYDHAAGLAALKEASGARLAASAGDAPLLEAGGRGDFAFGDRHPFPPVKVDVRVADGQALTVGDTTLVARLTPGHTEGTTTWLVTLREAGRALRVVIAGSTAVNPGVRILDNPKYPAMLDDFERTFAVFRSLPCDVLLAQHAGLFGLHEKRARLAAGRANPFVDAEGCRTALAGAEARFREQVAEERAGK